LSERVRRVRLQRLRDPLLGLGALSSLALDEREQGRGVRLEVVLLRGAFEASDRFIDGALREVELDHALIVRALERVELRGRLYDVVELRPRPGGEIQATDDRAELRVVRARSERLRRFCDRVF